MAKRYRPVVREQEFLLPPSVIDWLPEDHLVWFVIEAVQRMNTTAFHARARLGGAGRAGYDPDMVLTLFIYAMAHGGALTATDGLPVPVIGRKPTQSAPVRACHSTPSTTKSLQTVPALHSLIPARVVEASATGTFARFSPYKIPNCRRSVRPTFGK